MEYYPDLSGGIMPSNVRSKGRKPYTSEHYEAEIRKLFPEVQLLKAFCEANPEDESTLKELEQKKSTLREYRNRWAERVPAIAYVDGREQLPNSSEESGYHTERTPQYDAKNWPYYSVGDYITYVPGVGWYPVCRERKSLNDLYGTLMDEDHRKNLYDEFFRFLIDKRFTIFRFDLECTEDEFFEYLPPRPKICKYCQVKRIRMDTEDDFCPKLVKIFPSTVIDPSFRCHEGFIERKRDSIELQRLHTLKETVLRQCRELGMQIVWEGSREEACAAYKPGVVEWLKLNYVSLLQLDKPLYSDREFLEDRKAALEAEKVRIEEELVDVNASLARIETWNSEGMGVEV